MPRREYRRINAWLSVALAVCCILGAVFVPIKLVFFRGVEPLRLEDVVNGIVLTGLLTLAIRFFWDVRSRYLDGKLDEFELPFRSPWDRNHKHYL